MFITTPDEADEIQPSELVTV
jgi:hypothetical protein